VSERSEAEQLNQ